MTATKRDADLALGLATREILDLLPKTRSSDAGIRHDAIALCDELDRLSDEADDAIQAGRYDEAVEIALCMVVRIKKLGPVRVCE